MPSQLHQAVELARSGQREQARQMLRQVVQAEPNNEVAWLWLASVAADQPEYVRALNEVLRINPQNQQAQGLLADFQQQYGSLSAAQAPVERVDLPISAPPPAPSYPSQPPVAASQPSGEQRGFSSVFPAPSPSYSAAPEPPRRRRGCSGCLILPGLPGCGGCGCLNSCLVLLVVAIILPVVICGGVTYAGLSLGPVDLVAQYLPDQFGRKTAELQADGLEIALVVPRSWYLAERDNPWWEFARGLLDEILPFAGADTSWSDLEAAPGEGRTLLETNPEVLNAAGDVIGVRYVRTVSGSFTCDALRAQRATVTEYDNGLCGARSFVVADRTETEVFSGHPAPTQLRTITFQVPLDRTTAAEFQIGLPEEQVVSFEADIDKLIESADVIRQ